ncbi:Hsp33 family molecular chaperone HslO [Bacillus horti]|uniref:Molecular chaperone Hsp33 n=1 Tax=Caldalkalibacillus horti TaxID=77523 RepID=A0ABT9VUY8_9BACI|nr:Hsp33 family molecular chaperone HslO [Bacillus horti]MDQ0164806.1 molecular chaperone Hsp33 [Bacillus horti]
MNIIIKSLIFNKQVRLYFVDNTALIKEILALNQIKSKLFNLALGKTVSGLSLLSATMKGEQRLSATITMSNPRYQIFADVEANGNVRGYVSKSVLEGNIEAVTLSELIGDKAAIRVIKGFKMNQFTGITDMPYKTLDEDISHYFKQSDQIETIIKTNIEFDENHRLLSSYAMYAQLLPGAPQHLLMPIKEKLNMSSVFFNDIRYMCTQQIEDTLNEMFSDAQLIGCQHLQFFCVCSKEMFYGLLYSIDRKNLEKSIRAEQSVNSTCHVCGRSYVFSPSEIQAFLERGEIIE